MGLFKKSALPEVKLGWLDFKLTSILGIFIGLILVRIIPQLMEISLWWYIVLGLLCLIRVWYVIMKK